MGKQTKSSRLKSALQSQQQRLHAKEKIAQAAQTISKKTKGKQNPPPRQRMVVPFQPNDTILLVGEGDFTFARALVVYGIHPANICATAYDLEDECYTKYPNAGSIAQDLSSRGVQVIFGVDGTKLEKHPLLKARSWDRVVWNFPHAGKGITDQDRNILSNQTLILGFLKSVSQVLKHGPIPIVQGIGKRKRKDDDDDDGDNHTMESETVARDSRGTVLITLRNVAPYTLWDVPKLAKKPPVDSGNPSYLQLRSFAFHRDAWDGYQHRMTKGERKGGLGTTGTGGEDRTWEFCLAEQ